MDPDFLKLSLMNKQTDKPIVADNLAQHVPWLSAKGDPHFDITNTAALRRPARAPYK
jgi:hypothetical protein